MTSHRLDNWSIVQYSIVKYSICTLLPVIVTTELPFWYLHWGQPLTFVNTLNPTLKCSWRHKYWLIFVLFFCLFYSIKLVFANDWNEIPFIWQHLETVSQWKATLCYLAITGRLQAIHSPDSFPSKGRWSKSITLRLFVILLLVDNVFFPFRCGARTWIGLQEAYSNPCCLNCYNPSQKWYLPLGTGQSCRSSPNGCVQ